MLNKAAVVAAFNKHFMRYCGSKRKFMKYLRPILTKDIDENTVFVDLFGGGMNVVCDIPCDNKVAVDYNKYVIALWKELQENGMKNIPTEVSEEMYNDVKNCYLNKTIKYKDFIIGYVGTCCSFGGSWFNGYARFNPNKNEDHIKEAYNGLKKQVETFKDLDNTVFIYSSYEEVPMNGNEVVYCDPPYASTKKYETDSDNDAFWEWARQISKKVKKLYVSEYDAPNDFECIWQMEKKDSLGTQKGKKQNTKVEKLFTLKKK
jgi:DNA adenine methylase